MLPFAAMSIRLISFLVLLGACSWAQNADVLFYNGRILTVDPHFRIVDSLAVRGDRILAVGSRVEVNRSADSRTRRIDLRGRMVLPGLMDSHVHADRRPRCTNSTTPSPTWRRSPMCCGISGAARPSRSQANGSSSPRCSSPACATSVSRRAQNSTSRPAQPRVFGTGPDASVNTLALKLSGIDQQFPHHRREARPYRTRRERRSQRHPAQLRPARPIPYRTKGTHDRRPAEPA